jgi:Tfp pilus assembly protein PilE
MWLMFGGIGILTAIAMMAYDRFVIREKKVQEV